MNPLIIITILTFLLIGSIVIIADLNKRLRQALKEGDVALDAYWVLLARERLTGQEIDGLKTQLAQASKNDHRDARGRYSKAEEA